jgi:hypothetical protein
MGPPANFSRRGEIPPGFVVRMGEGSEGAPRYVRASLTSGHTGRGAGSVVGQILPGSDC